MDIRARLLLAFAPLLILLVGTAVALPFVQRESEALLQRQGEASASLYAIQSLELAVLREHDAAIHLAEGEEEGGQGRLERARQEIERLLRETDAGGQSTLPYAAELGTLHQSLVRRHDSALANLGAGDQAAAEEAMHDPTTDALLEQILTLADRARAESQTKLDEATAALRQSQQSALGRAALSTLLGVGIALLLSWLLVGQVVRPLNQLTTDAERYADGDGVGQLSSGGSAPQIRRLRDAFQRLLDANQARQERVQSALTELEQRVADEERLRATVEALSLPLVPLQADTLLLPLVGHLDRRRSATLIDSLLRAIQERRARAVVLDITGLAELNEDAARLLRQAGEAARLLGCRMTLVGVRSDQAIALVAAELQASGIQVARDIPAVLERPGAP